ncbi:NAD dependent epimerase/dehydratase family protein [mine drainage metagenome]|uniref:NAD dependent epimerase/dehydratase family protein n=1 Tax=mine drainage metagenome TaxID=410659 RepID=A0A1J5QNS2_9ZZZZ
MKVLVTGAQGFIGKNLIVHLRERADVQVTTFLREDALAALPAKVQHADFIFHLAGINRPKDDAEFLLGNGELTGALCDAVRNSGRSVPIVYTSSIQAERDNAYGRSKRMAEEALQALTRETSTPTYVYRLPNIFGKWCRPNYNSAVATFCHNIARGLPVQINDPASMIQLAYVDDVISDFLQVLDQRPAHGYRHVGPVHEISVGEVVRQLYKFKESRTSLVMEAVGEGFTRALYSTFISYFTPAQFAYPLVKHEDARGVFVEVLKTHDCGQFSYFSAHPGVTRGGHYHHTKTEKFMVIKGAARFCFRHVESGETYELSVSADTPEVVETIPGWSHDITNVGQDEMIVMLWANEVFDRQRPDTISYQVRT